MEGADGHESSVLSPFAQWLFPTLGKFTPQVRAMWGKGCSEKEKGDKITFSASSISVALQWKKQKEPIFFSLPFPTASS